MPLLPSWIVAALLAGPALAGGEGGGQDAAAWALVVGSDRPGPGQQPLRFAHQDAERVQAVFTELGGFPPEHVTALLDPGRDELLAALDDHAGRVAAVRERGEPSSFLFYYSGHARARALDLGPDEVDLQELDARLQALGATVTLAVLDACQAGALSEVEGAQPAADFSYNSVAGLRGEGIAVMASSSGTEISQESAEFGGSYFTHHLVTGLRGAADQDLDGGTTEYSHPIPAEDWQAVSYSITPPERFRGVRFRIRKLGDARAVVAQVRAQAEYEDRCSGVPIRLDYGRPWRAEEWKIPIAGW